MRILLTNDDGIHAHGLKILEQIAAEIGGEATVVAPETDQSGVAHSLSLNDPLRLRKIAERHFAVRGTPTDCVIMGARKIMADNPPNLLLSGVNRGQNVAEDVTYSGTIAAAMEGALIGIPAIALSQAYGGPEGHTNMQWECARAHAPGVIKRILKEGMGEGTLVNVNFPPCPPDEVAGVSVTTQGRRDNELLRIEERTDGRGNPYYWLMAKRGKFTPGAGTDIEALAAKRISITPLRLNLTDPDMMARLSTVFA